MDARRLSPGWRAKREVLEAGGDAKAAGRAYRDAMRNWQDLFYAEVGQINGLDRYGPRRQRLTRAQFRAAKAERVAAADRLRDARDAALAAKQAAAQAQQEAHDAHERATQAQIRQQMASARAAQLAEESQQLERFLAHARALEADLRELPELRTQAGQDARRLELIEVGLEVAGLVNGALQSALIRACRAMTSGGADEDARLLDLIVRAGEQLEPGPSEPGPAFD